MPVIEPDQDLAIGRGGDEIKIAVMVDVALDDAGDWCLKPNGRSGTRELDRDVTGSAALLNPRRVESSIAVEITNGALRR
jgi:hypothetical protein